jgi:hypothetical protein
MNTKFIAGILFAGCLNAGYASAYIIDADYGDLSGNGRIDFDSLATGGAATNYNGIIDLDGASFAEHFSGQTLGMSGMSDVLSGTPAGPLILTPGLPSANLAAIDDPLWGNVLVGLGPLGFDQGEVAYGEGAVAILFDNEQGEFGFEYVGGDLGLAVVEFWGNDGSLLGTFDNLAVPLELSIGFQSLDDNGALVNNISGVSIYNTDKGGIGFDNIIFNIPGNTVSAPGTILLFGLGLIGLGCAKRKNA